MLISTPRQYNLVITEHDNWVGGDGVPKKKAMLINGQFPGTQPRWTSGLGEG